MFVGCSYFPSSCCKFCFVSKKSLFFSPLAVAVETMTKKQRVGTFIPMDVDIQLSSAHSVASSDVDSDIHVQEEEVLDVFSPVEEEDSCLDVSEFQAALKAVGGSQEDEYTGVQPALNRRISSITCNMCGPQEQPTVTSKFDLVKHWRDFHGSQLPIGTSLVPSQELEHCPCGELFLTGKSLMVHMGSCACLKEGHRKFGPHYDCSCAGCKSTATPSEPRDNLQGLKCCKLRKISMRAGGPKKDAAMSAVVEGLAFLDDVADNDALQWRIPSREVVPGKLRNRFYSIHLGFVQAYLFFRKRDERALARRAALGFLLLPSLTLHILHKEWFLAGAETWTHEQLLKLAGQGNFPKLYEVSRLHEANYVARRSNFGKTRSSLPKKVKRLVQLGEFSRAAKALAPSASVKVTPEVVNKLEQLFPCRKNHFFKYSLPCHGDEACYTVTMEQATKAARKAKKVTAPGPSGSQMQIFCHPFKVASPSSVIRKYKTAVVDLINQVSLGDELLCSLMQYSVLVAIPKADGGVRPICIGETFRRFASSAILVGAVPDLKQYLEPYQMVLSQNGCERVTNTVRTLADSNKDFGVVGLDGSNAFGNVSRAHIRKTLAVRFPKLLRFFDAFYLAPSAKCIVTEDGRYTTIHSHDGVEQGDPFGPAYFALAVHEVLLALNNHASGSPDTWNSLSTERVPAASTQPGLAMAYADDFHLVGHPVCTGSATGTIYARSVDYGLYFNCLKSFAYSKWFKSDIIIDDRHIITALDPKAGCKMLGSFYGQDKWAEDQLYKKAFKIEDSLKLLDVILTDLPQEAFLLLRSCFNQRFAHLLRTTDPVLIRRSARHLDHAVNAVIARLAGLESDLLPEDPVHPDNWPMELQIARLKPKFSGLAINSMELTSKPAFIATTVQCIPTVASLIGCEVSDLYQSGSGLLAFRLYSNWVNTVLAHERLDEFGDGIQALLTKTHSHLENQLDMEEGGPTTVDRVLSLAGKKGLQSILTEVSVYDAALKVFGKLQDDTKQGSSHKLARFISQCCPEAAYWHLAPPVIPEFQLEPQIFTNMLSYHLLLPLAGSDLLPDRCSCCSKTIDDEGTHMLECHRTYAHDALKNEMHLYLRAAGVVSVQEPGNIAKPSKSRTKSKDTPATTPSRTTQTTRDAARCPDILARNLVTGKKVYIDITSGAPNLKSYVKGSCSKAGFTAALIEKRKANKYKDCADDNRIIIGAGIEIPGRWGEGFISIVKMVSHSIKQTLSKEAANTFNFIWKRRLAVVFKTALFEKAKANNQRELSKFTDSQVTHLWDTGMV